MVDGPAGDTAKDFNDNFGTFPWAAASPFGYNGRFVYARTEIQLSRGLPPSAVLRGGAKIRLLIPGDHVHVLRPHRCRRRSQRSRDRRIPARAGVKVLVLERREVLGGACVTEELWPGYKVSTAAYVNSLLRPEIIRDLELKRHGFEMLPRSPSSFTPFPDGRSLLLGPDKALTHREISKFSAKDAEALPKYEQMLERVAEFLEPTLVQTPPNPWSFRPRNLLQLAKLGLGFAKLGADGQKAIEILTGAATPILDRWFESEQLKVTSPPTPSSARWPRPPCPAPPTCCFTM